MIKENNALSLYVSESIYEHKTEQCLHIQGKKILVKDFIQKIWFSSLKKYSQIVTDWYACLLILLPWYMVKNLLGNEFEQTKLSRKVSIRTGMIIKDPIKWKK